LQHISQVIEGGATAISGHEKSSQADGVIVCAGLGARMLGGVEDKTMYPIRGQTVLLKAPWVRYGRTMVEKDNSRTYTIPRKSGDVRFSEPKPESNKGY
jgi:glycine/D-amino acid oxidase-like deaminating enzyme